MRKSVSINDVTFLITKEEEVYFTGRISYNSKFRIIQENLLRGRDKVSLLVISKQWFQLLELLATITWLIKSENCIIGKWIPQSNSKFKKKTRKLLKDM
jgi:hypothetical protein